MFCYATLHAIQLTAFSNTQNTIINECTRHITNVSSAAILASVCFIHSCRQTEMFTFSVVSGYHFFQMLVVHVLYTVF